MRNEDILIKIGVALIEEKMRENCLDGLVMCDVDLQMRQSCEQSVSIQGKLKERRETEANMDGGNTTRYKG